MADLLLDEQRVEAFLDQVGHIRVPQAVRVQHRVQAEVITPVGEPVVNMVQAVVHSSTSAGDHSHGGVPQKSPNRRTCEALVLIVCAASNATFPNGTTPPEADRWPSLKSTTITLH